MKSANPIATAGLRIAALLAVSLLWPASGKAATDTASNPGYLHYQIGDVDAPRPSAVEPGLLLMGGSDWPLDAFRWFVGKAGQGHIVILRASGADELQDRFFNVVGGIASAQTLVFSDRSAASDPQVLDIVARADGIFIAGGDQSNYVRYWKDTPLSAALDRHAALGKPLGGTSAGLAILGAWSYGALDGGSIGSERALSDPLATGTNLVDGFLHLPPLARVITDSHFEERNRLGRLVAFLAALSPGRQPPGLVGLGIDENTALCIDGDGGGRVHSDDGGHVWLVQPGRPPEVLVPGQPLTWHDVAVTGLDSGSRIDLHALDVADPAFRLRVDVADGLLTHVAQGE